MGVKLLAWFRRFADRTRTTVGRPREVDIEIGCLKLRSKDGLLNADALVEIDGGQPPRLQSLTLHWDCHDVPVVTCTSVIYKSSEETN